MTTITKNIAAKLAVAFVAVAMVLVAFAPSAQAQTTEELQAMINDLLAQVAALQGGAAAPVAASSVCPFTWTRDLSSGSTGADVMKLQQFLNADPDTRVAASGAGSLGAETSYYGGLTAAAVSKMQVKYRADVLSPAGLVNPTGYFGPSSRAKANALCVAAPVMDDDDDMMDDDDDMMDDDDDRTLSGEASLDEFEIDSADEDELEEGAEDAPVAELTFQFTDGDAEISRIDIKASSSAGSAEEDPWDVFETFQLWVDGDLVAEEDADDEDEYLDEDEGTFRFSGLDLFGEEDEDLDVILAVTLQNSLDGLPEEWNFSVESMRFFDADGVATTENSGLDFGTSVSVDIDDEGFEDELLVKSSSNDPDAATLQVEDDSKSDWYTIFVFDLDTDDSTNDIEINGIPLTVAVSSSTVGTLVDDLELVIDGVTIDDFDWGTDGLTRTATFDVDGDVVIDAGDRVEAELMARFKSLALGNEGVTASASISSAQADAIDAEGGDDLDATQLSGSATGDDHTLRTAGIEVSPESFSNSQTSVDGADNDTATFEIVVELTAFEQDVYIDVDPATSISYSLVDGTGATATTGSQVVVLTSSADEQGSYFEITEGETETLTLQVTYTPGADASARLRLNSISFAATAVAPTQTQTTLPKQDYRTGIETLTD